MARIRHSLFDQGGVMLLWKGVFLGAILGLGVLVMTWLFDGGADHAEPAPTGTGNAIDLLMSMHPDAKRVLLLGGAPGGAIPRLLAYPIEALTVVSLDLPTAGRKADSVTDPRQRSIGLTGPRLTGQVEGPFDLIIQAARGAGTLRGNRFYLVEWFQHLKGLLARDGILLAEWSGPVGVHDTVSPVGAMIYQSLNAVFPVVQVTASQPVLYMAGTRRIVSDGAPRMTFDGGVLRARQQALGIAAPRFEAEWLMDGGALDEAATDALARGFRDLELPPNRFTEMTPLHVTMSSWRGAGGAVMKQMVRCATQMKGWQVSPWFFGGAVAFLLAGLWARLRHRASWRQSTMSGMMGAVTILSLALGLTLTTALPWAHGTLPVRVGLTGVTFVAGYTVGVVVGRVLTSLWRCKAWLTVTAVLLGLLLVSEAMPRVVLLAGRLLEHSALGRWVEWGLYPLLAGLGFLRGLALTNGPDAGRVRG